MIPFGICVKVCLTVIHDCFGIFVNDGLNKSSKLVAFGMVSSKILSGNRKHFYVVQTVPVFRACSRSGW